VHWICKVDLETVGSLWRISGQLDVMPASQNVETFLLGSEDPPCGIQTIFQQAVQTTMSLNQKYTYQQEEESPNVTMQRNQKTDPSARVCYCHMPQKLVATQ
jgi:hypothetical protein